MSKPTRGRGDVDRAHGIRFHLAPSNHRLPPRHVMLLFHQDTAAGHAAAMVGLDEAWPNDLPKISAVVVGALAELDEAKAFVAAHLGPGAQ